MIEFDVRRYMREAFSSRFLTWGIEVERMELLDIEPRQTVVDSMKTQMIAERVRRSQFIEAEGKKTATRIRSEGTKVVKQNEGLAQQETTRKISEGEAEGRIELARAESQSLELVRSALQMYSNSQAKYMLAMRYLELLNTVGYVCQNKTIYLPYESDALSGSIAGLRAIYGREKKASRRRKELIEKESETSDMEEQEQEVEKKKEKRNEGARGVGAGNGAMEEVRMVDVRATPMGTVPNFDDLN